MKRESRRFRQPPTTPRGVAISGIVFSVLFIISLSIVRSAIPADPSEPGSWLADPALRDRINLSLNLVPFTGIAFLWYMAVLRDHIGRLEDRFFATVFLGSGLLFVAMLFASVATARGLVDAFATSDGVPDQNDGYRVGRATAYALLNTFGMRMSAVFMFVTSTIGVRTGVISRFVSFIGFAFGLILLLVITDFAWISLLFPIWALVVSTYILLANARGVSMVETGKDTPGDPGNDPQDE